MAKKVWYRVENVLYGTSQRVKASSSTDAKRRAVKKSGFTQYQTRQLMKHLSAKRI